MFSGVTDTHALISYIWADPRMSRAARTAIELAGSNGYEIGVSSITMVELVYLTERNRVDRRTYSVVKALLNGGEVFREVPITRTIAEVLATIPRDEVPDMPDRIIANSS